MAAVDYAGLRNRTLADGQDSEVTVNTRALIDKVLARYSSEHTTLRELIQNASDAGATTVVVKFETDPSPTVAVPQGSDRSLLLRHIIQNHTLKRLTVSNNGQPFNTADWNRLRSIADGNPDETKIGAFGVGFYSVFADCDEPFVVSGDKTMAFYWKGNTLSTKIATVPAEAASPNTTFLLDFRQANPRSPSYNPSKLPNLPTLGQFLATSLTFVGLQSIELHVDDFRVATFTKKMSPPLEIRIPDGLKGETEGGMMRVKTISRQQSQIQAEWSNVIATAQNPVKRAAEVVHTEIKNAGTALKSFFSKFSSPAPTAQARVNKTASAQVKPSENEEHISGDSKWSLFLQVCTVEVETRVTKRFSAEIERATKKPPPRTTRIALLTSPYHDSMTSSSLTSTSGNTADLASKIFQDVLPRDNGRIFIGFPTAQTTPFLAHVSAPSLIPTVERENIDMNARYIKDWNVELLRVAGLACRISYSLYMADIRDRVDKEPIASVIPQAVYVSKQFTPQTTHPSTALGERMVEAFFNCSKERTIAVLSTTGVGSSQRVRMPAETLSFLRDVPMVPQELATQAVEFFLSLHQRGFISELTMTDIYNGLEARALSEEELLEFLKWCGEKLESSELDPPSVRKLFAVTVAHIGVTAEGSSGKVMALGSIRTYLNASRINPALPVPPDTVPFSFSKAIPIKQLQLFGWVELAMVPWLQFLTTGPQLQDLASSEDLAMQVLGSVSKTWDQLDNSSKQKAVQILTPHAIMPTKMGMRRPQDSYFPGVKLFEDLPNVKPFQGSKDKFLQALGVRKTVDLAVVFDRMKEQSSDQKSAKSSWRHGDLIRYFASVLEAIPQKDLERLRQTPFLPGQGALDDKGQLYKAQDLYAPNEAILELGLTQVKLPFDFRATSKEATFLFLLGLKRYPNTSTIVGILHRAGQSKDSELWALAMKYFLQNYSTNNYASELQSFAATVLPILPTEQSNFPNLVAPSQCFANEKAACLGFPILRKDLRLHTEKFGVRQDPDISICARRLLDSPPKSRTDAEQQFSYLAARSSELQQYKTIIQQLSSSNIVPVFRKFYLEPHNQGFEDRTRQQNGKFEYRISHHDPPEAVFVGTDQDYAGIIDYVQFSPEATAFLLKVGAKHEPTSHDLASLLCQQPSRFLSTIGQDRYLELLRKLSDHATILFKDNALVKRMSASRCLVGFREIKEDTNKAAEADEDTFDDLDDMSVQRELSLYRPNEVVIIDDVQAMTMFRHHIVAAPQEEQLEEFYAKLGTKKISELIKEDRRIGPVTRDQSAAQRLRKDILQRARLFLHEHERDASRKSIRHDAKWLSNNLAVRCVSDISIRRTLTYRDTNASLTMTKSASIVKSPSAGYILNVTPTFDHYDVARELVPILIRRAKQNDVIALERILTESLRRLQAKGINVERILRQREYEARIAKQQEYEQREQEAQAEKAQAEKTVAPPTAEPGTPEKAHNMPGAFGTPEKNTERNIELAEDNRDHGVLGNWAKKFFKNNNAGNNPFGGGNTANIPPARGSTDGPQINRDIQVTKSNIANAIKQCGPTNRNEINTPHHQDPTELDKGGYCSGEQWENLHKAFTVDHRGRKVDIYYGKHQTETVTEVMPGLSSFMPLIFALTAIFGVNPAAVSIFLDDRSNTVAFNLDGSLFFNLAWFNAVDSKSFNTVEGKVRACDSWFLTYCHELAHNLVKDHNARHNWYNQQIAIEYSQKYRTALNTILAEMGGGK